MSTRGRVEVYGNVGVELEASEGVLATSAFFRGAVDMRDTAVCGVPVTGFVLSCEVVCGDVVGVHRNVPRAVFAPMSWRFSGLYFRFRVLVLCGMRHSVRIDCVAGACAVVEGVLLLQACFEISVFRLLMPGRSWFSFFPTLRLVL